MCSHTSVGSLTPPLTLTEPTWSLADYETARPMKYKITASFNPRDVSDKSPDIQFDGEEENAEVDNIADIKNKTQSIQDNFFGKFGERKGKVRMIKHWNPKVWNNKVLPNMKYEVEVDGKKKEGSLSDIEDFLKGALDEKKKPVGIPLRVQRYEKKRGGFGFRFSGYIMNKRGKKQWGFMKEPKP